MKLVDAIGEGIGLYCIIFVLFLWIVSTVNGLVTGVYGTTLYTNMLWEHYFELGLLVVGLYCYIRVRGFRWTWHPKKHKRDKLMENDVCN